MTNKNLDSVNFEGMLVRIKQKPEVTFKATGGFGCNPECSGTKVFLETLDGKSAGWVRRSDVTTVIIKGD